MPKACYDHAYGKPPSQESSGSLAPTPAGLCAKASSHDQRHRPGSPRTGDGSPRVERKALATAHHPSRRAGLFAAGARTAAARERARLIRFVIDASAAVEYLLRTPLGQGLDDLVDEASLLAPSLLDVEVMSVLRRAVLQKKIQ